MSIYETFLSWWYDNGAHENTKVVIVDESELQSAISKLNPPSPRKVPDFYEPELFVELKKKFAQMRYQRNLRMFNSSL